MPANSLSSYVGALCTVSRHREAALQLPGQTGTIPSLQRYISIELLRSPFEPGRVTRLGAAVSRVASAEQGSQKPDSVSI
jgi:hypothetical protein